MTNERILIGATFAILCVLALVKHRWLLAKTPKGRRLVMWFGEDRAPWILRGLIVAGIAFGVLLAAGIIRPIAW